MSPRPIVAIAIFAVATVVAFVGASADAGQSAPASWKLRHAIADPQDVAGPRGDGSFVVTAGGASGGALSLLDPASGRLRPFARGVSGYATTTAEPYIALARRGFRGPGGCEWGPDATYAIEAGADPGLVRISRRGVARRFARFAGFPAGIAFDSGGRFDHRLLVAVAGTGPPSVLYAFDCDGDRATVVADGPQIEGGMAIAPRSFGRFGGDLIAPGEVSGNVYALSADGTVRVVAESGLPFGGDIGVESAGFVPELGHGSYALVADPGRDGLLSLSRHALRRQGVRGGDLLVAAEGSPTGTIAIRCAPRCRVSQVAFGPEGAGHAEGHIRFYRGVRHRGVAGERGAG